MQMEKSVQVKYSNYCEIPVLLFYCDLSYTILNIRLYTIANITLYSYIAIRMLPI